MSQSAPVAAVWTRVLASILAFLYDFFRFGSVLGWLTGNLTSSGFNLNGAPALALFVVIIAYFYLGRRHAGGTLWDRVFGIARPQPN